MFESLEMFEFEKGEFVIYLFKKEKFMAIFDGYANGPIKNAYITLIDGSKIMTHKNNLYKIVDGITQEDYLSIIDIALDTGDKEWFEDLRKKYIGGTLIDE